MTCSDQYLDDRAGFSRGCYRTDFEYALGGFRAATAKVWFGDNAGVTGGRAYVAGMHAFIKVVDEHALHFVQLELNAPADD